MPWLGFFHHGVGTAVLPLASLQSLVPAHTMVQRRLEQHAVVVAIVMSSRTRVDSREALEGVCRALCKNRTDRGNKWFKFIQSFRHPHEVLVHEELVSEEAVIHHIPKTIIIKHAMQLKRRAFNCQDVDTMLVPRKARHGHQLRTLNVQRKIVDNLGNLIRKMLQEFAETNCPPLHLYILSGILVCIVEAVAHDPAFSTLAEHHVDSLICRIRDDGGDDGAIAPRQSIPVRWIGFYTQAAPKEFHLERNGVRHHRRVVRRKVYEEPVLFPLEESDN
mmetsp:Transcript_727/g.2744  ORF Transcript_727/g.2744 Transcript_727/m.2744 type:complete len:276 (+) Transcript_727:4720-5547(+)